MLKAALVSARHFVRAWEWRATLCGNGSLVSLYKGRGGPAQLGIRDWAGLKRHGDDRNLAFPAATEAEASSLGRGKL